MNNQNFQYNGNNPVTPAIQPPAYESKGTVIAGIIIAGIVDLFMLYISLALFVINVYYGIIGLAVTLIVFIFLLVGVVRLSDIRNRNAEKKAKYERELIQYGMIQNGRTVVQMPATQNANKPVADEIMKLKQLMDQGIITPQEFEIKKRQLLGF